MAPFTVDVLTQAPESADSRSLLDALRSKEDLVTRAVPYMDVVLVSRPHSAELAGEAYRPDGILPRIIDRPSPLGPSYGLAVVSQLEVLGVRSATSAAAAAAARDKWVTHQRLEAAAVPHTPAMLVSSKNQAVEAFDRWGTPLVAKPQQGTGGLGVVLVRSPDELAGVVPEHGQVLAEPFLGEGDVRVIVVDGEVVASVLRRPAPGDFRSNLSRGGQAEPFDLGSELVERSVTAVAALELDYGGVDLLPSEGDWLVSEVNAFPSFSVTAAVTSTDIAGAIVEAALARIVG